MAIFSNFIGYSLGNFKDKANVTIQRHPVRPWLFGDPIRVTLDDLEWLFHVKFCFRAGLSGLPIMRLTKIIACLKTNEDRHTRPATQSFRRDSSFGQYKVCADIRAGSIEKRRQITVVSRQWRNLELGGPWAKMQGQPSNSKGPFPIPLSP